MAGPELSQEQIDKLIAAIEKVERKRKTMLAGYLLSLLVMLLGQAAAFWIFVRSQPGTFMGWVFMIPFAGVGLVLWLFGRLARRIR